jgi:carbon-monoxide dehydrogenase medium subunit
MQVPAPFAYERATSVDHAISLLEQLGPEARVIAGGHSLLPMMKLRLARPEHLIDINDLAGELGAISIDGDHLVIGAMARHADLLASAVAGEHFPMLHDAERVIADPVVRNRGTIGGSLCQADPAEDLSAALSALHAIAVIRSGTGTRTVPVRELHTGPYETVVGDAELLTEIRVPIRNGCGSAYEKLERRVGDWAIAASAAARRSRSSSASISRSTSCVTNIRASSYRPGRRRPVIYARSSSAASIGVGPKASHRKRSGSSSTS